DRVVSFTFAVGSFLGGVGVGEEVGVGVEAKVNVTATFFADDIVTVQVEVVPVQSPLQLEKVEPEFAVAIRVTDVPLL
ncbi:hypothetical protein MBAV_000634, partial [Candidatus Magnetobacterium bavaricum]